MCPRNKRRIGAREPKKRRNMKIREWFGKSGVIGSILTVGEQPEIPLPPVPVSSPVRVMEDGSAPSEYKALAAKLGVQSRAMSKLEMREFLAEECVSAYDVHKVMEYMNGLVEREKKSSGDGSLHWVWKPLRQRDSATIKGHWTLAGIPFSEEVYPHEVPYPVLLTVKKLTDKFGDRVCFHVSDYKSSRPDPFLMASIDTYSAFVIERWDEPSFRG
jgi:hypothetical protein